MANQNIGHVVCPLTKKLAVVRADCRGKLYYFSEAGKITPNLPQGQEWLRINASIWAVAGEPDAGVSVKEIVRGAPPIVEVKKALTGTGEQKQPEKALTDTSASERKPDTQREAANDSGSIWDYLTGS